MKQILFLIFPLLLVATSSFISKREYATQLYKNPRGIGCQYCHGENGEGKLIAKYVHNKKKRSFSGPSIHALTSEQFYRALTKTQDGMPRYYLTKGEVDALYFHIHENDANGSLNVEKH